MACQDIVAKIISDANMEAEATLNAAREKAAQVHEANNQKWERRRDDAWTTARESARQNAAYAMKTAAMDEKKRVLAMKRLVIDEAFSGALRLMINMSADQKTELFDRLLSQYAKGGETLLCNAQEAELFSRKLLKKYGLKMGDKNIGCAGGFILDMGGIDVNCTYETMIKARRDAMEADVAAVLFPQGEGE